MALQPEPVDTFICAARKIQPSPAQVADVWRAMLRAPPTTSVSPEDLAAVTHTWRPIIKEALADYPEVEWTEHRIAELAAVAFCWGQATSKAGFVLPSLKEAGP